MVNPLYRLLLNHPLLRMALAWAAGILLGWYMRYSAAPCGAVLFIVAGVLVALTLVLAFYKKHGNEYVFGGLLYAVVFLLGSTWLLFHFHRMQKQWPSTAQAYQAVVVGDVSRQGKTTVCPVRIVGCVDGDAVKGQDGVVQLRFLCDSTQQNLHVGDGVRFYGVVEKLRNPGNPDELDYATWLGRQGVSGGIFAGTHVKKVKEADANILRRHLSFLERLRLKALTYRVCLVRKFDRLQLHSQQEAVLQAMALGDKGQLSSQTRRIFSEVGASHVLALSGLHLGVLTFLILWLFRPLGRWRWGRMASVVVLLAFIWGFALLTGLHVSLCRAALMYSVGLIHYAMRAKGNAMDSLAFAAIVLLVWQPMNLMDVGFQLSFMSVFSILLFYPSFVKRCPRSRMWAWLAGLVFIAVASQVGAAPLTAHYFHLFSLGFLITNVVVIPCTYLLLGSALLYFLFEWLPVVQGLVGKILAWVSHFMYDAVELMARC
ncbi:MAG: ComEC/Rec2 family competence protein [Bacteroidaceae bacterium]|nr:ComEC/Rec2 family competence protein [Bacteroidaceae bacterium]